MQVTASTTIKHNGKYYKKGEKLEVNEAQAASLLFARSIEPIKGIAPQVQEEPPKQSINTPEDKKDLEKNTEEVANTPIKMTMKKTMLIGIARANGLIVEKTATPSEVFKMITEYRKKNNIVIGDKKESEENKENANKDLPESTPDGANNEDKAPEDK